MHSLQRKLNRTIRKTITNPIINISDKLLNITEPILKFPPNVQQYINKYGNNKITNLTISRNPVNAMIQTALNFLSNGKLNELPYDTLFHLQLFITLDNNTSFMIEKNERINAGNIVIDDDTETMEINNIPDITFSELLNNGLNFMGKKRFFIYHSSNSNCQDFILNLLHGNNINEQQYNEFIKQDATALFNNNTKLRKLANTLTDIGARFNQFINGGSVKKSTKWIDFVKNYAHKHNITFKQALKDAKDEYHKQK